MSTPIPDEQVALLRAIIERPDEDTPRLVYADWLQEHGDEEQAMFIRDSIALESLDKEAPEWKPLVERVNNPQRQTRYEWIESLGVTQAGDVYFSRGLPHALIYYGKVKGFLSDAEAIFACLPIRELRLDWEGFSGVDDELKTFAALPGLARIDDLCLVGHHGYGYSRWETVLESHYLRARRFGIVNCTFNDDHAQELAECRNLARVEVLDLAENAMGPEGILAIVQSPHLQHVKEFSFVANSELAPYLKESYDEPDEDDEELDREPYLELVAALNARFGNANALTEWL